ncbi:MAG: hypothetical protein MMC23_008529 [Stictis urceolatum]|nr:hypothetical protein [Stictis urceolata]
MSQLEGSQHQTQLTAPEPQASSGSEPKVVGIYGLPGSGKTYLLSQLKQMLSSEIFAFYEGSEVIGAVVDGGLDAFHQMEEQAKKHWRERAIDSISMECANSKKIAIVTGHFMFWSADEESGRTVHTQRDLDTFSMIFYLNVPAQVIFDRRKDDRGRSRPCEPKDHLLRWQNTERALLRTLCREHNILFSPVTAESIEIPKIKTMLSEFCFRGEEYNLMRAREYLEDALKADTGYLESVLVIDADRTLTSMDTGALFWETIAKSGSLLDEQKPLKALFSSPLGYSHTAFLQATLLYEEAAPASEYDICCQCVAHAVEVHPEFVSLLRSVADQRHVGAVVVTCGLGLVWRKVLAREGLSHKVKVIGGGRIEDGFVVTPAVKATLTSRLNFIHHLYVWAFGDSLLDLGMMKWADRAVVVVGDPRTRSRSMDKALENAIDNDGLKAHQALLPSGSPPRLNLKKLPTIQLDGQDFLRSILCHRGQKGGLQLLHATNSSAAKLLMTPMRDASVEGPQLREAHRRTGQYLAAQFLADVAGLEQHPTQHVQAKRATGYHLLFEEQTLIVALMRGGEPMAFGVNEVFPQAMFLHAKDPDDLELHHLQKALTVVLVDSVVNNGKTVDQFVRHIRKTHDSIRIVIVAGVVQAQAVSSDGILTNLAHQAKLSLIALRLSNNKFTGSGSTDTGNRLFNTTHLE